MKVIQQILPWDKQFHHIQFQFQSFKMIIQCFILSSNNLMKDKLIRFVSHTYFLEVFDKNELSFDDGYPILMFLDMDSFKLGAAYIKKMLLLPLIPVFISSMYSKSFISNWLQIDTLNMGYLNKTADYTGFIEEISRVIDHCNIDPVRK